MATDVTVPSMGESINDAVILRWIKSDGDQVSADEPICELETDKATFDLPAPATGVLKTTRNVGDTVQVGDAVAQIDVGAAAAKPPVAEETPPRAPRPTATTSAAPAKAESNAPKQESKAPKAERKPEKPAASERKAPAPAKATTQDRPAPLRPTRPPAAQEERSGDKGPGTRDQESRKPELEVSQKEERSQGNGEKTKQANEKSEAQGSRRVPMSKIRRRIAERLVRAQRTAAMLTTFNEIDMTAVLDLRERHKEQFEKEHGVSLGLMSFFSRATVLALKQHPAINAEIDGDDIIYHDHVHLGIAVNTERGLVVPVLRHVENMSFATLEGEIKRVAATARDGKLALEELSGGTFTITNGGIFGSLLSTPILNPPQTGILGMHTIQKRPVVIEDRIKARRMMYVALSYDHRLVDGRDAVQFLVQLKRLLEDPMSMLLEG